MFLQMKLKLLVTNYFIAKNLFYCGDILSQNLFYKKFIYFFIKFNLMVKNKCNK